MMHTIRAYRLHMFVTGKCSWGISLHLQRGSEGFSSSDVPTNDWEDKKEVKGKIAWLPPLNATVSTIHHRFM